ncbi:MAG: hypothetical protein ACFFAH_04365 [Promethearchaeota archaeon]
MNVLKMAKKELFIKRVYEIVNELKIPLIDERVYEKVAFNAGSSVANVTFKFEEDESVIRGFLGLAEYFHTVVIKRKDEFFIPHSSLLFRLMSS